MWSSRIDRGAWSWLPAHPAAAITAVAAATPTAVIENLLHSHDAGAVAGLSDVGAGRSRRLRMGPPPTFTVSRLLSKSTPASRGS